MASVAEIRLLLSGKDEQSKILKDVKVAAGDLGKTLKTTGDTAAHSATDFDKSAKSAGGLGSALGSVSKIAAGFVIGQGLVKLPGLIGGMIDGASDLNENMSKVQAVFGKEMLGPDAGDVIDWAAEAAENLGVTRSEALGMAGTLGNLFGALGMNKEAMFDMSTQVVELATDLGSFNNLPTADVLEKLRAGLVGEAEPLRSLGVNMNAAMVETKALSMTQKALAKDLTEADKVAARYAIIMDQTKTAQGDFARTSAGHANQMKILKAQFGDLRDELGTKLLPVVVGVGRAFIDYIVPGLEKAAGWLSDLVAAGVDKIGGWLEAAKEPAQAIGETLLGWASISLDFLTDTLWPFIQDVGGAIGQKAGEYLVIIKDALLAAGEVALGFITDTLWPFLKDAGGDIGRRAAAAFVDLRDAIAGLSGDENKLDWDDLNAGLEDLHDAVKPALDVLQPLAAWVLRDIKSEIKDLKAEVEPLRIELEKWEPVLRPLAIVIGTVLTVAIAAFIIQCKIVIDTILIQLEIGIKALTLSLEAMRVAWEKSRDAVLEFADKVTTAWDHAKNVGSDIKTFFQELPENVKTAIGDVATTLKQKGEDLLNGLWDGAREIAIAVGNWFIDLPDRIVGYVGDLSKLLWDAGVAVMQGFLGGLKSMWDKVTGFFKDLTGAIPGWKGPPEKDKTLLYGSGQMIMQGLIHGLQSQVPALESTLGAITSAIATTTASGYATLAGLQGNPNLAAAFNSPNLQPDLPPPPTYLPGSGPGAIYTWGDPNRTGRGSGVHSRNMGAGGGHNFTINISAIDGESVRRIMPTLVDEMNRELGRNYA